MKSKVLILLLLAGITTISAFVAVYAKEGPIGCGEPYFFRQGYSPDAFEYHTIAANLALHDRFPYYGFMSSMDDYHLSQHPDSVAYFRDIERSGAIVFDNKPPLYPLLLGFAYKALGFKPCSAAYFNLCCIVLLISLIPVAGFLMGEIPGAICGVLAAFVFMYVRNFKLWYFTAETLTSLLVMVVLCAGIMAARKTTIKRYVLLGFCFGILALCKGMFLGTFILISGYLIYMVITRRTVQYLTALLSLELTVVSLILMWMAYINPLVHSHKQERMAFARALKATAPRVMYDRYSELFDSAGHARPEVVESLNKFHQYDHASGTGLVMITTQMKNYDMLNVHNEYCTDGDFHPEWLLIRNSFYNRHTGLSQFQKIRLYYQENPRQLFHIAWAKVRAISGWSGYTFYFAIFCALFAVLFASHGRRCVTAAALLVNILLIQVVIYADMRFIDSVAAISMLVCMLSLGSIVKYMYRALAARGIR